VVGTARTGGLAAPSLPENAFGRGLSRADAVRVGGEISKFGPAPRPGSGCSLPRHDRHTRHSEQIDTYIRDIVTGKKAWCQLFSEPGAGSDLAGLTCKAMQDGDEYVVNGQKCGRRAGNTPTWACSSPHESRRAEASGITYFALDMHQPGVEIRPLKEMTGHAMFNEVFLSDARVSPTRSSATRTTGGRSPTRR